MQSDDRIPSNLAELPERTGNYLRRLEAIVNTTCMKGNITEWDESVLQLLMTLSELFHVGLKSSLAQSLFTSGPSYWQFVREFTPPETVRDIRKLPNDHQIFKNPRERENAWLILTLNHGELGMYVGVIRNNRKLVKQFYSESGGAVLLDDTAMDLINDLINRLVRVVKFTLSLDEYIVFITQRNNEPIPPVVPMEENGRIYNPVPVISAPVETFEEAILEEEGSQYVSQFRDFIETSANSTQVEPNSTQIPPNPSNQVEENIPFLSTLPLEGPSPDAELPLNSIEHNINKNKEPDQLVPILEPATFAGDKRENLYSPSLASIQLQKGTEELHAIIHKRTAPPIRLIEDLPIGHPVIISTPSADQSLDTQSQSSTFSEFGFFGIPLNVGDLFGIMQPIPEIVVRISKLAMLTMEEGVFEEALTPESFHTTSLLSSSSIRWSLREKPQTDGYQYELRPCPTEGLSAQNNECISCHVHLVDESVANLCDISGKYYCNDCFNGVLMVSPARIITNADFEIKLVAKEVAQNVIRHFPITLLNLRHIGEGRLYEALLVLSEIEALRERIALAMAHVEHCSSGIFAEYLIKYTGRRHLILSSELFTIDDLINIKNDKLLDSLGETFQQLSNHVKGGCDPCQSGGRYCELCNDSQAIYRFDTDQVTECPRCGILSHIKCAEEVDGCVNCRRVYMTLMSPFIEPAFLEVD